MYTHYECWRCASLALDCSGPTLPQLPQLPHLLRPAAPPKQTNDKAVMRTCFSSLSK